MHRPMCLMAMIFALHAGSLQAVGPCDTAGTRLPDTLCAKPELAELAALADRLGRIVGQHIPVAADPISEDFGLSRGITRLLSVLTLSEAKQLAKAQYDLPWQFHFDHAQKVLRLVSVDRYHQGGIAVFAPDAGPTATPEHAQMGQTYDAQRLSYAIKGRVLEVTAQAGAGLSIHKYRFQNGCWRLIGEDAYWPDHMVEFSNDLTSVSVNHLTGLAILTYFEDPEVRQTFTPLINCLSESVDGYGIQWDLIQDP